MNKFEEHSVKIEAQVRGKPFRPPLTFIHDLIYSNNIWRVKDWLDDTRRDLERLNEEGMSNRYSGEGIWNYTERELLENDLDQLEQRYSELTAERSEFIEKLKKSYLHAAKRFKLTVPEVYHSGKGREKLVARTGSSDSEVVQKFDKSTANLRKKIDAHWNPWNEIDAWVRNLESADA